MVYLRGVLEVPRLGTLCPVFNRPKGDFAEAMSADTRTWQLRCDGAQLVAGWSPSKCGLMPLCEPTLKSPHSCPAKHRRSAAWEPDCTRDEPVHNPGHRGSHHEEEVMTSILDP